MAPAIQQFKNFFATDSPRIENLARAKDSGPARRALRSPAGAVARSSHGAALFCAPLARLITPPSPLLPALLSFVGALLAQSLALRDDKRGKNLPNKLSSLISTKTLHQNFTLYKSGGGVNLAFPLAPLDTVTPFFEGSGAGEAFKYTSNRRESLM